LRLDRVDAIVEYMSRISTKEQYYYIEKADQLELLASPVRQNILDSLESMGPSSVTELARAVGLSADSLYYHVKKLTTAGLIVESGTRPSDRRDESVYSLPSSRIRLRYNPKKREQARAAGKIVNAMLRTGGRDFQAGLDSNEAVADGAQRNLWGARLKGWLDAGQLREVNKLLEQLHDVFNASAPNPDKTLCALTWSMAPVEAQPVRRPAKETPHRRTRKNDD